VVRALRLQGTAQVRPSLWGAGGVCGVARAPCLWGAGGACGVARAPCLWGAGGVSARVRCAGGLRAGVPLVRCAAAASGCDNRRHLKFEDGCR